MASTSKPASRSSSSAAESQYIDPFNRWQVLDSSHGEKSISEELRKEAEIWLRNWLTYYKEHGRYKQRAHYNAEQGSQEPSLVEADGLSKKNYRDNHNRYFHEAFFLKALYDKCPSEKGKQNMQIEILLTISIETGKIPEDLSTLVNECRWDDYTEDERHTSYPRLQELAQILYIRMVIPCE